MFFNLNSAHLYNFLGHTYALNQTLFINLPMNFFNAIQFPDFSIILTPMSLKYIIMFALVGSIESILTVCAVNSMTSQSSAPSDLNKDLRAVGIANLVCAFIGGLPMISEIVRSKANIDYGAQSAKSNFFHGIFMLIAVILFPTLLNFIPLSALAALLIFVGLKLASPKEFIHAYEVGKDQFLLFFMTFVVTLAVDLLAGVVAGILLKLIIHRLRGHTFKSLLNPTITIKKLSDRTLIQVEGPLTFISYLKLKKVMLSAALDTPKIIINLCLVTYMDHTVLKKIQNLSKEFENIEIIVEENQQLVNFYNHPLSTRGKS
jgi:MFS superfamily sulfate permease-like transporter